MWTKIIIAGLLLVLLGFGAYWYLRGGTKLTDSDSLLLADFVNSTGDPVFEGSLGEALAIGLAQSPVLNLISPEK